VRAIATFNSRKHMSPISSREYGTNFALRKCGTVQTALPNQAHCSRKEVDILVKIIDESVRE
jgi:hypothetical protein